MFECPHHSTCIHRMDQSTIRRSLATFPKFGSKKRIATTKVTLRATNEALQLASPFFWTFNHLKGKFPEQRVITTQGKQEFDSYFSQTGKTLFTKIFKKFSLAVRGININFWKLSTLYFYLKYLPFHLYFNSCF